MKDIVRSLAAFKATDKVGGSLLSLPFVFEPGFRRRNELPEILSNLSIKLLSLKGPSVSILVRHYPCANPTSAVIS